ncbi:MAG: hypothetical protein SOU37_05440, partial [Campylobacter lanienae]|nr:hypothetical protein [Campylobacteraceae bacterium]MDY2818047.1 hypothetical protein [Campylobacter lanienae]
IIRLSKDQKLQYLELQEYDGWVDIHNQADFSKRFGRGGVNGIIIDADSLAKSKDLHAIIGYLNTEKGKELKGKNGNAK